MPDAATSTIVGHFVFLLLLLSVVWVVFREVARTATKIIIPAAVLLGLAIWLGLVDATLVESVLTSVGEGLISGLRRVADWITETAFSG